MNIQSTLRKALKFFGFMAALAFCLVLAAAAWYMIQYYPRQAEPYEINTADISPRILIATQGSDFKNDLVSRLGNRLEFRPAFVKVMDIGELDEVDIDYWDKIIVLNTAMMNKLDSKVEKFILRVPNRESTLLVVTSGGADFKPANLNVDAISGASRMADIGRLTGMILDWMEKGESFSRNAGDHVLAMEYFLQVDVEAACAGVRANPEDYLQQYSNLEGRLNGIGYDFLKRGMLDRALVVFCLNKDLFPQSWNVFDSYADALLASGDQEAAMSNYRKSVVLNPGNENGRRQLESANTAN
jgi:tetratricopeptide (TPR) repeat protein